jgi:hypothetical protein
MAKATQGVQDLVHEILAALPKPHSEDITDEVCLAIEKNPKWTAEYDLLSGQLRDWVVNNWIGQYVALALGRKRGKVVESTSTLIRYYSKLPP